MKANHVKEHVFKDIRQALMDKSTPLSVDNAAAHHSAPSSEGEGDDICVHFAEQFTTGGGTMYYCYNEGDIKKRIVEIQQRHGDVTIGCASDNLTTFLGHLGIDNRETCDPTKRYPLGAILCEALIANHGEIVITSNLGLGKTIPTLCEATVVLAFTSQVVPSWPAANERLKQLYEEYPEQMLITNPCNYAIRKGHQKIYLILIEDED